MIHKLVRILFSVCMLSSIASAESSLTLKVGAIYGLSGPLSSLSWQYKNGALLAVEFLKQNKVVDLEILFEDSQWQSKTAVSAFNKLKTINRVNIFHVLGSPMTLALKPLTEAQKLLLFSAAAHPKILPDSKYTLRHGSRADLDAEILAQAVKLQRPKRVATIYIDNEWAESFNEQFIESLIGFTKTKVVTKSHLPGETDFRAILTNLFAKKIDVLIVNSFGLSSGHLIIQARELGFQNPIYANNGFSLSPDAISIVQEASVKNLFYQSYKDPPQGFIDFYEQHFGESPKIFELFSFTDYELLGKTVAKVGVEPKKIVEAIKKTKRFKGNFLELDISTAGDIIIPTEVRSW